VFVNGSGGSGLSGRKRRPTWSARQMTVPGGTWSGFVSLMSLIFVSECDAELWSWRGPWDTGEQRLQLFIDFKEAWFNVGVDMFQHTRAITGPSYLLYLVTNCCDVLYLITYSYLLNIMLLYVLLFIPLWFYTYSLHGILILIFLYWPIFYNDTCSYCISLIYIYISSLLKCDI
jgi:hypothetical protein